MKGPFGSEFGGAGINRHLDNKIRIEPIKYAINSDDGNDDKCEPSCRNNHSIIIFGRKTGHKNSCSIYETHDSISE